MLPIELLLKNSWDLCLRYKKTILQFTLFLALPALCFVLLQHFLITFDPETGIVILTSSNPVIEALKMMLVMEFTFFTITFSLQSVILFVISMLASIALTKVSYEIITTEKTIEHISFWKNIGASIKLFIPVLFIATIITTLIFFGLLVFVIPGIIFSVWFSFVAHVYIIERISLMASFKKSRSYVRNHFWPIILRIIVIAIIPLFISFFLIIPTFVFSAIGLDLLLNLLVVSLFILVTVYTSVMFTLLYVNVRTLAEQTPVVEQVEA